MKTIPTRREVIMQGLAGTMIFLAGCRFWRSSGLEVRQYPDVLLRKTAVPVAKINDYIVDLGNGMENLLKHSTTKDFFLKGDLHRGVAAPQVGVLQRIIVCALRGRVQIMVNPEIAYREGTYFSRERCLSLQGYGEIEVRRSAALQVRYTDLDERMQTRTLKGSDAALVEHEVDHLNGVLYIDHAQNG